MASNSDGGREDSELNIARRTRSHLRIEDFVPDDNLDQFPDVDMNLYQNNNSEIDSEYKKFCQQCFSDIGLETDTNTDDNDPSYVHNDDIFSHGWSFDLNEELHLDDSESNKNFQNLDSTAGVQPKATGLPAISLPNSSCKSSKLQRRKIDMFDEPEFARILNQQLRQHIQLLTQAYLLANSTKNPKITNKVKNVKDHLTSYMDIFKDKRKPSNLMPAMNLVNNFETPKDAKLAVRCCWRHLPIPDQAKNAIRGHPEIFMYPSLLPEVGFSIVLPKENAKSKQPSRGNFTENEDKLLVCALDEFKNEPRKRQFDYIASLLMPAKTNMQIENHIKNINRSHQTKNNPIKLYFESKRGEPPVLPVIDLDSDSRVGLPYTEQSPDAATDHIEEANIEPSAEPSAEARVVESEVKINEPEPPSHQLAIQNPTISEDLMNMDLDDLMAASTTISRQPTNNASNNKEKNGNVKNLKLKQSIIDLMSHKFTMSPAMGDKLIETFLKTAQQKLSECSYIYLLQLLTNLLGKTSKVDNIQQVKSIFKEITELLKGIQAPRELQDRVVLFLNMEQATACGCASNYLHWMRFFEFIQHVELYHEGDETFEKKLSRLIDALQKDDPHKVRLATANLISKHPLLRREFESLDLNEKPHPSLFLCQEDFDDVTEPAALYDETPPENRPELFNFENFTSKVSARELSYASQSCPCKCHNEVVLNGQPIQHCGGCNLKFVKGRMYLVNKIKPILAEYVYSGKTETLTAVKAQTVNPSWTFEEDREILEFCRLKAEQNDETVSFDVSTFEELVSRQHGENGLPSNIKKSAREIAERFNHLMEMYRDENSSAPQ